MYFNEPTRDGGVTQIVKWSNIRRAEKFMIPQLGWKPKSRIALAFDPARTSDNSIVLAMNIYKDPNMGWCGEIINAVNLTDVATKNKFKLDSNRQIAELRNMILNYNGHNPDYEYIDSLMIDAGSGGGGLSTYADGLLNNWTDASGREHRGFIDPNHEVYAGYSKLYPDAVKKLKLLNPKKYRTQMVEEFIDLMDLGVITMPFEYSGNDYLRLSKGVDSKTGEEIFEAYELSEAERSALVEMDLMKTEITSIHKFTNPEKTSVTYALSKDKENTMHDDRFYAMIMLAHRLYEIRRGETVVKNRKVDKRVKVAFRKPKIRKI